MSEKNLKFFEEFIHELSSSLAEIKNLFCQKTTTKYESAYLNAKRNYNMRICLLLNCFQTTDKDLKLIIRYTNTTSEDYSHYGRFSNHYNFMITSNPFSIDITNPHLFVLFLDITDSDDILFLKCIETKFSLIVFDFTVIKYLDENNSWNLLENLYYLLQNKGQLMIEYRVYENKIIISEEQGLYFFQTIPYFKVRTQCKHKKKHVVTINKNDYLFFINPQLPKFVNGTQNDFNTSKLSFTNYVEHNKRILFGIGFNTVEFVSNTSYPINQTVDNSTIKKICPNVTYFSCCKN